MTFSPKIIITTAAFGLCLAAATVSAQDAGKMAPAAASSSMGHMDHAAMQHKMQRKGNGSMHKMPATVDSVDGKTGIVEVTTAGMSLRVHFPPASVAGLKAGDKITLHMGYSK